MKYKCLLLDHDDTVVASTEAIHYPSFIAYVEDYKPQFIGKYSFLEFIKKNFDPGVLEFFHGELGLTDEELVVEDKYWRDYVATRIPAAYEGMAEIIADFRRRGGIIGVASHSYEQYIRRDYEHNGLPTPDVIYGWDLPREKRKPAPFTVLDICERYRISPSEVLVVDDLKPGYDMARAAGADFAAAGWAYDVPEITAFMKQNCDYYLSSVAELKALLEG